MQLRYSFASIEELLDCATKTVAQLRKLFPHVNEEDLKAHVLEYLLKSSTLKPTQQ